MQGKRGYGFSEWYDLSTSQHTRELMNKLIQKNKNLEVKIYLQREENMFAWYLFGTWAFIGTLLAMKWVGNRDLK